MRKVFFRIVIALLTTYVVICILLYFFQEKILFYPDKLDKNYQFRFDQPFEEFNIIANDKKTLSGILFKADSSKGLIFYLHGNAGALNTWGDVAKTYTTLHYDVYMLDYRGYGKSEGSINNEKQFFDDVQIAYDSLKNIYDESKIVLLGYSMGTGLATKVASTNHPKLLILQAPYYSMTDMMNHTFPIIPTFILKYKLQTNEYIKNCKMPIVIFHGNADEVIYYGSSLKLKPLLKPTDTLITLNGQGHDGITDNPDYRDAIKRILAQ